MSCRYCGSDREKCLSSDEAARCSGRMSEAARAQEHVEAGMIAGAMHGGMRIVVLDEGAWQIDHASATVYMTRDAYRRLVARSAVVTKLREVGGTS